MTCLCSGDDYLLPKTELHRSLQVGPYAACPLFGSALVSLKVVVWIYSGWSPEKTSWCHKHGGPHESRLAKSRIILFPVPGLVGV